MRQGAGFVVRLEDVLGKFLSPTVGHSVLINQLAKSNKRIGILTEDDCKTLVQNVLKTVSPFLTKEEAEMIESELDKLF